MEIAGRVRLAAAFVAGLIYAFLPYRVAQIAHIQSLSSQWMPLALYGLRRFIVSGQNGVRWLAASAALLMQNWSCGYYLIFFAPFVPLFVIHQMWTAGRLREWKVWATFDRRRGCGRRGNVAVSRAVSRSATGPRLRAAARRGQSAFRPTSTATSSAPAALRVWGEVMQALPESRRASCSSASCRWFSRRLGWWAYCQGTCQG